ncbi:DNA (cytosine-5)-methyltransferase 1 [Saccharopolyspora shandongensis]|uniref:DNA (Cytosine-5)-methyltransferase 1 n=1 Tax=Saccharopolyspora shandongensis TaxID=418495 RepID=A0A1H3M6S4_9PSEU|nr:DNA cytosine methyltransferase [Saccharopolyspora shandongensis]SDY71715.1 DNA (cytosine-5)-methyltransferase 1 [Saccharopolyspora shandongensis]
MTSLARPLPRRRPRLLDLYSCAGGAGMGYHRAGFDVVGVDIAPQPRYPFEFHQADALEFLAAHGHEFDAIHASPPCQAFTNAQRIRGNDHPDLIAPTRDLLIATGRPWVIENVEGAPLHNPVMLCGAMFPQLKVYRHRLFETNFPLSAPAHPEHVARLTKMGRPPRPGEFMHVVGNFSGVQAARDAMGIDWMTRDTLREAIPPVFTEYIGAALLAEATTPATAAA